MKYTSPSDLFNAQLPLWSEHPSINYMKESEELAKRFKKLFADDSKNSVALTEGYSVYYMELPVSEFSTLVADAFRRSMLDKGWHVVLDASDETKPLMRVSQVPFEKLAPEPKEKGEEKPTKGKDAKAKGKAAIEECNKAIGSPKTIRLQ